MLIAIVLTSLALVIWVGWWWFIARNRPAFPPLAIANDDPLMLEATRKAKASLSQLRALFAQSPEHARVKVPFISNSGETEHLWAELLAIDESEIEVRYLTPSVSHTGTLERVHRHLLNDIEDWVFTKDPTHYVGGFSMRVMFIRGREAWGDLPPELKAEETKYAEVQPLQDAA